MSENDASPEDRPLSSDQRDRSTPSTSIPLSPGDAPSSPATGAAVPHIASDSEPAPHQATSGQTSGADVDDLIAARNGDHQAFARLYDRHAAVILSYCRREAGPRWNDLAEAEDALQETFIRAHRLLHSLESPASLRSWLFGIARRVCSERRRAAGRRRRHESESAMTTGQRTQPPPLQEADAQQRESLRRLGFAIEALPEPERLAIHLFYLDPDPVRAAAEALGLSRSGFYKLLARAREHLAARMQETTTS